MCIRFIWTYVILLSDKYGIISFKTNMESTCRSLHEKSYTTRIVHSKNIDFEKIDFLRQQYYIILTSFLIYIRL